MNSDIWSIIRRDCTSYSEMEPVEMDGLFPHQRRDVNAMEEILGRRNAVLNGGDTGTGKTRSICALSVRLNMPIFGIVPKPVVPTWFDEAAAVGANIIGLTNYESAKNGKYYKLAGEFFAEERSACPYLRREKVDGVNQYIWDLPAGTLVVFDEAHRGKNTVTQTSKLMESAGVLTERGCKIAILSATITDSIECFRVPSYLLGLAQRGLHAYRAWLRTFKPRRVRVAREGDPAPGGPVEREVFRDETQAEIIHRIVYEGPDKCGVRTRIRDLQADRDEIVREMFLRNDVCAQTYDMSPEVEAEIEAAHAEIEAALRDLKNKQQGEECPLTIILRARQRIEMLKVPTLGMLAMEYVDQEKSVVLFVNFNETATRLFEILDPYIQEEHHSFVTFINGGQSPEERAYNINAFRQDRSRIMIANIRAGGVGISLHDINGNFGRVSLISPTWSSIELKQALGRIHRAGARTPCIQRIVYCKGRVSTVGRKIADDAMIQGPGGLVRAGDNLELKEQLEARMGNDTTFKSKEGKGRVGVEEYMAEAVNRKLCTIEWLNNGDADDLQQF